MASQTFGEFILAEMRERDMSAREFARFIGISPTVINKFLNYGEKEVGYPSVDFLLKLAKATETDVGALMRMLDPELDELDPQVMVIAQEIANLSPHDRRLVEGFVRSIPKAKQES
jgi:transcriptional regulator with XRE-family HTH domain